MKQVMSTFVVENFEEERLARTLENEHGARLQ